MTRRSKIFNALNEQFQIKENGEFKIDQEYFIQSIKLMIDNTKYLYDKVLSNRVRPHSLAWEGFTVLADDTVRLVYPDENIMCNRTQLKLWLAENNANEDILNPLITSIADDREEIKKFKEKEVLVKRINKLQESYLLKLNKLNKVKADGDLGTLTRLNQEDDKNLELFLGKYNQKADVFDNRVFIESLDIDGLNDYINFMQQYNSYIDDCIEHEVYEGKFIYDGVK